MTSTARSAMRLASSWMVIASGIVTSRTSFSFGSLLFSVVRRLLAAAERRLRALAHFVGAQGGDQRQAAARPFGRGLGGAGRPLRRRRRAHARRRGRGGPCAGLRFLFGFELGARTPRRRGRGGRGLAFAEALLGDLVGLLLGFVVVLAALVFLALARLGGLALGLLDGVALLRGSWPLPRRSCALRPRAGGHRRARGRGGCCSSSVSVRSTTPDAFGAGAAGAGAGAGAAGLAAGAAGGGALGDRRRCGSRRRGLGLAVGAGDAALLDLDDHLLAAAMAEALAHHAGLGARLERQRRLRRRSASCRQGSWSQPFRSRILSVPFAAGAAAGPSRRSESAPGAQNAPKTCHLQARQAGLHVPHLTGPMPNPIGPS